jgi:hypothetical protein
VDALRIIPFVPHNREKKCNEKYHNLYPSPNVIRMIKSRKMGVLEYAACIGEFRNALQNFVR